MAFSVLLLTVCSACLLPTSLHPIKKKHVVPVAWFITELICREHIGFRREKLKANFQLIENTVSLLGEGDGYPVKVTLPPFRSFINFDICMKIESWLPRGSSAPAARPLPEGLIFCMWQDNQFSSRQLWCHTEAIITSGEKINSPHRWSLKIFRRILMSFFLETISHEKSL